MVFPIFGGAGFVGRHLYKYLSESGHSAISYDLGLRNNDLQNILNQQNEYLDVRIPINLPKIKDQIEVIFNLAAIHTTPGHENHEYFEANIKGAENICKFAEDSNASTIVFTSSISVYGSSEDLKTEDSLTMPTLAYGSSKLAAEWIHRTWQAKEKTRKLVILRPGVVFGLGEGGNFTRLYNAMKKGFFIYPGRRDTLKACIYVKDFVRVMVEAARSEEDLQLYNVCYENPPTIEEICETIAEVTGVRAPIFKAPAILLRGAAGLANTSSKLLGGKKIGIHPERIKKLMISNNISGEKLGKTSFSPQHNLKEAIEDWYEDCGRKGLF